MDLRVDNGVCVAGINAYWWLVISMDGYWRICVDIGEY